MFVVLGFVIVVIVVVVEKISLIGLFLVFRELATHFSVYFHIIFFFSSQLLVVVAVCCCCCCCWCCCCCCEVGEMSGIEGRLSRSGKFSGWLFLLFFVLCCSLLFFVVLC